MLTLVGGQIVTKEKVIKEGVVTLDQGKIVSFENNPDSQEEIKLQPTDMIFPGFIDLHVHGGAGSDVMEDTEESLKTISAHLARFGVTGWLATTYTASIVDMADVGAAASWLLANKTIGAELLGVHHEGPFISPAMRDAHPESGILEPNLAQLEELIAPAAAAMVTIAPELPGAMKLFDLLKERKIIAAIGHTQADFAQVEEAIKHGAKYVVHCFNGLSGFDHQKPGGLGAALIHDEIVCEVLADLVHVHPAAIKLLLKAKGPDRVALASDAIAPTGLKDGVYKFAGQHVRVKNNQVRLENNELAGSVLTMNQAVKNMIEVVGITLKEASIISSKTPAKVLGLEKQKGEITLGFDADLCVLDKEYNCVLTVVGGNVVFQKSLPADEQKKQTIKQEIDKNFEKYLKTGKI